jgi:predicted GNAT superfamily acetyltransferase
MALLVRDAVETDEAFILAVNAACTPAVGDMDAADYAEIRLSAHAIRVAEVDGSPAGFIILIRPLSAYRSLNYAWFEERFARHLYIDRIAIAEGLRGHGVGRALYEDAARLARAAGEERLTAEVNEDPPNPQSIAFHNSLGFNYLLSRPWKDKVVAMFERPL